MATCEHLGGVVLWATVVQAGRGAIVPKKYGKEWRQLDEDQYIHQQHRESTGCLRGLMRVYWDDYGVVSKMVSEDVGAALAQTLLQTLLSAVGHWTKSRLIMPYWLIGQWEPTYAPRKQELDIYTID